MARARLERVLVGVSGGIDSAVSAAFFTDLLGPRNVLLVNMPSRFNTETTKGLAAELMSNLNTWSAVVSIEESVALTRRQLDGLVITRPGHEKILSLSDFHLENVQARDRSARILAGLASAFDGVFPSNANKAETTVGYATLLGDHAGFLAPLADLWKHQIYALGRHLNEQVFGAPVIPEGIFDVRPSAELSDAQDPEKGGGDPMIYWYHDKLFEAWMQRWRRCAPEDILGWYADGTLTEQLRLDHPIEDAFPDAATFIADLERWWKLFKGMGVVKRLQAPPVVAVCRRAFGFDYRESLLDPYFTREYTAVKSRLLS
jgi:NAD+ synthase (glutamine-hydrolysing)